jgi:magnesium chelatase subunit I
MPGSRRAAYVPYPFAAIVAQDEAKLAVLLAAINPRIGGVLLSGPKGIGKTTLVRGVGELLPAQERNRCPYGCEPGASAQCAECAGGSTSGRPHKVRSEIVELPANAQIDDVIGAIDLRAALERGSVAFRPGLLARANRTLLYVDEINLLSDAIVDVLLDAAAQGVVRVKRGQHTIDYPSRFTLVGTMNPEEGELRPQITDRVGLRVFVAPAGPAERVEIYRRNAAFARDPLGFSAAYAGKTRALRAKVAKAIASLPGVVADAQAEELAVTTVTRLGIESHRTEFVALEAACALAAFEGRSIATAGDLRRVFALAARLRRSRLRAQARTEYLAEDAAIDAALGADSSAERDAEEAGNDVARLIVAPEFSEREPVRARPQNVHEGQPLETRTHTNGRVDVPASILQRATAVRTLLDPDVLESVDASIPLRLTVFVVDASQSAAKSAEAVAVATQDLLRPIYAERERAALISCWGPSADIVVDENVGRNVELVATWIAGLESGETRALTPLPDALDQARRMAERFRRANPNAEVEIAVFSDGRANVPLGGEPELRRLLAEDGNGRGLSETAADQCRTLAARIAGRAGSTFVNLDDFESSALMRELATIAHGRYFALNDIVARIA